MIKLKNLLSEEKTPKEIVATYIENSGKLYSIRVDGKKVPEKYIHQNFVIEIPKKYDEKMLKNLVGYFKKFKIKFDYNDSMDVS